MGNENRIHCEDVRAALEGEDNGVPVTGLLLQSLERHAATCPSCHVLLELRGLLAFSSVAELLPPLTGTERAGLLDSVVTRNQEMTRAAIAEVPREPRRLWRHALRLPRIAAAMPAPWRWSLAASFAVLVVLGGAIAGYTLRAPATMDQVALLPPASQAPTTAAGAAVLLMASGADADAEARAQVESNLERGATVVAAGRLAVAFPPAMKVLLMEGARISVERSPAEISIRLTAGCLVAAVQRQARDPVLVVGTVHGSARVLGTVLSVCASRDDSIVEVAHGRVQALLHDGQGVEVKGGKGFALARSREHAIDAEKARELGLAEELLARLSPSADASLRVSTSPHDSPVAIDGFEIGPTPLFVRLAAGTYQVGVTSATSQALAQSEQVSLAAGEAVVRMFELPVDGAASSRPGGRAAAAVEPSGAPVGLPVPSAPSTESPAARAHEAGSDDSTLAPTALELMTRAQSARAQQRWQEAADAYRLLLELHPQGARARLATLSLADLKLAHLLDPAGALALFDDYLQKEPAGSFAAEAAYGRTLALAQLGRHEEERAALRDFTTRYPLAVQAETAGRRLQELEERTTNGVAE